MSSFDPIRELLARYYALEFHQNPQLAARLATIQHWQKRRMQHMHAELFAVPEHHLMTQYFMTRLYGGPDFEVLAEQCAHVLNVARVFESLVPESTIQTAFKAIELTLLSIELDQGLAQFMAHDLRNAAQDAAVDDAQMIQLYQRAQQADERRRQLDLLDSLGHRLDKYVHSALIKRVFKFTKGLSSRHGLNAGYAFLDEGFIAMAPLKSAEVFIRQFTQGERAMIDQIYAGTPNPLGRLPQTSAHGALPVEAAIVNA